MSLAGVTIDWNARPYIEQVRTALRFVAKEGAEATAEDAKRNLERWAPDSTGTLASQIDIRASQFEDGGWIVEAQGHGNYGRYYASFVELGTSKMAGLAYLRKALRRNRFRMRKLFERELGAIVR